MKDTQICYWIQQNSSSFHTDTERMNCFENFWIGFWKDDVCHFHVSPSKYFVDYIIDNVFIKERFRTPCANRAALLEYQVVASSTPMKNIKRSRFVSSGWGSLKTLSIIFPSILYNEAVTVFSTHSISTLPSSWASVLRLHKQYPKPFKLSSRLSSYCLHFQSYRRSKLMSKKIRQISEPTIRSRNEQKKKLNH